MTKEDKEKKTTFIKLQGTYWYNIFFGLKNMGTAYQREMVMLFHNMMHKKLKVYMDDMIIKLKEDKDHTQILRKLFEMLYKYQLKSNLEKYTFGITSRKMLGFIVSNRDIKVDPYKVKAIQAMPTPITKKIS